MENKLKELIELAKKLPANTLDKAIEERNRNARGFATIYLNRYNALFQTVFRGFDTIVDEVYNLMTAMNNSFVSISHSQSSNLLVV